MTKKGLNGSDEQHACPDANICGGEPLRSSVQLSYESDTKEPEVCLRSGRLIGPRGTMILALNKRVSGLRALVGIPTYKFSVTVILCPVGCFGAGRARPPWSTCANIEKNCFATARSTRPRQVN